MLGSNSSISCIVLRNYHPNTMQIKLYDPEGKVLLEREYYSVGGGFIEWKGHQAEAKPLPPYPYTTFKELKSYVNEERSLFDILLANEMALTGKSEREVMEFANNKQTRAKLKRVLCGKL